MCEDFGKRNNLKKESRDKHYQMTSTTNSRFMGNVDKLLFHFKSIKISFESSEHMYNIASNDVLSESVASDITNQQSIGKKMYESFKSERIYGEKSISDDMKMCKLQTFKSSGVMIKTKIEEKLIQLKEHKQLLQRVFATSQKRPEINLTKLMFSIDGKVLPCIKKSQILHTIEKSVLEASMPKRSLIDNTDEKPLNAAAIGAMALLNKIQITPQIKTCSEIKTAFKDCLLQEASKTDDIRLVFDRCLNCSLNPIQDGLFRGCSRMGGRGALCPPLSHISYNEETWHSYTLPKEDPKNI